MKIRSLALVFALIAAAPQYVSAQGLFQAFGFPKTALATGQTEVLGSIQLGLEQGSTLADTLVIDVSPLVITNASASDILVAPAGNVVTGTVTIDSTAQQVKIPVNAGGNAGSIRIDGIRVALAGTNSSSVTARLSWAGNANYLFTTSVTVVDSVQSGLVVDPMTDLFQIYNNTVVDNTATITLHEGFASAFVNSTAFGESTPTQIRIRVTDFPSGLQMVFPVSVTANESAATLTTVGGTPVTLPLNDGTTTVTYSFSGASNSSSTVESFSIPFTVSVQGPVAIMQPTIDVSFAPIGAAVPSMAFPSTSIPRYAEDEENALAGTSRIITQTLYWTGIDNAQQNRLSILNPGSSASNLTLTALNKNGGVLSGNGITNPVAVQLGTNQSQDGFLTDLFGSAANSIATVRVDSTGPSVKALGTVSSNGESASIPLTSGGAASFVIPILASGGTLQLFNPGSAPVSGSLTLSNAQGSPAGTTAVTVGAMAEATVSIQDAFGTQTGGQIVGSFATPVVTVESLGSGGTFNLVPAQIPAELPSLYVPFFAVGGGYETDLNLINSSTNTVTLSIQPYDSTSAPLGSPKSVTLAPGQQFGQTASQFFGLQGAVTGYVQIQVPLVSKAFFSSYPPIAGYARIHAGQLASSVLPLSGNPQRDSFILSSGVSSGEYQGVALINPNTSAVSVALQVIDLAGHVVETANLNLAPGQIVAKLTSELFSIAVPERSAIRVTASAPIVVASVIGTQIKDQLRVIPAQ